MVFKFCLTNFFDYLVSPLKKLEWLSEPLQNCLVGKVLPAFGVKSSAFLTDTLQLICHGEYILIVNYFNILMF